MSFTAFLLFIQLRKRLADHAFRIDDRPIMFTDQMQMSAQIRAVHTSTSLADHIALTDLVAFLHIDLAQALQREDPLVSSTLCPNSSSSRTSLIVPESIAITGNCSSLHV